MRRIIDSYASYKTLFWRTRGADSLNTRISRLQQCSAVRPAKRLDPYTIRQTS